MVYQNKLQLLTKVCCYLSLLINCIINLYGGIRENDLMVIVIIHSILNTILIFLTLINSKHKIHIFIITINAGCLLQLIINTKDSIIQYLLAIYWVFNIHLIFKFHIRSIILLSSMQTLMQLIIKIIIQYRDFQITFIQCQLIIFLLPVIYSLIINQDSNQQTSKFNQNKFSMLNKLFQVQNKIPKINIETTNPLQYKNDTMSKMPFAQLFNQIPLGIIILSEEQHVLLINNTASSFLQEMADNQPELNLMTNIEILKRALRNCINNFLDPSKSMKFSQENIKKHLEKFLTIKNNFSFKSSQKIEKVQRRRAFTEIKYLDYSEEQPYSIQFCQKNNDELDDPISFILNYQQTMMKKKQEGIGMYYQVQSAKILDKQIKDIVLEEIISIKKKNEMKRKVLRYHVFKDVWQGSQSVTIILIENITHKHKIVIRDLKYQFQNMLLNSFSHELKTPLNCSMQLLELLQSLVTNQNHLDNYILPSLISMKLLYYQINDILDYASFESNCFQYHFKQFKIKNLLEDCKNYYNEAIKQKNQKIHVKVSVQNVILNDPDRIMQILINLLNNSIKFTSLGGEIVLESKESKRRKGLIVISVKDNGIGIKSQQLMVLKQNLYHESYSGASLESFVNNYNQVFTGLGLKIANKIVRGLVDQNAYDFVNQLQIASLENQFTRIKFYIQNFSNQNNLLKQDQSQEEQINCFESALSSDQGSSVIRKIDQLNRHLYKQQVTFILLLIYLQFPHHLEFIQCICSKILVVDDVPFNHQAIKILLNFFNFSCDSSFNGLEALQQIKEKYLHPCSKKCRRGYQIILMDIEMPIMNGYDASFEVKQQIYIYKQDQTIF